MTKPCAGNVILAARHPPPPLLPPAGRSAQPEPRHHLEVLDAGGLEQRAQQPALLQQLPAGGGAQRRQRLLRHLADACRTAGVGGSRGRWQRGRQAATGCVSLRLDPRQRACHRTTDRHAGWRGRSAAAAAAAAAAGRAWDFAHGEGRDEGHDRLPAGGQGELAIRLVDVAAHLQRHAPHTIAPQVQ